MIETTITVQTSTRETIQDLLRRLLEGGVVDAWLVPMRPLGQAPGGSVAPMLVKDPAALEHADPLAPVLPINAARAASQLTLTGHREKLGLVMRACEIRALVELVKFQQASLDGVLIAGIDCLGTYPVVEWQAADQEQVVEALLASGRRGEPAPFEGMEFRSACQMCEQPLPAGEHVALTIGLVGVEAGQVYLKARDDVAGALELEAGTVPAGRKSAVGKLVAARTQARDEALAAFRERVGGNGRMEGLLREFSACIRCHNCMINCPICYCREADRKGTVRLLPDMLLFHLTRMNHMVTSCVGCGVCSDVCPVEIPVATAFRAVAEKAQAIFDYHPGRSLDEAAPVQEFREDELTTMGKRPHS